MFLAVIASIVGCSLVAFNNIKLRLIGFIIALLGSLALMIYSIYIKENALIWQFACQSVINISGIWMNRKDKDGH